MTKWCGLFLTLLLVTGCGEQTARSIDGPPATSQPSADHPEDVLITQEKATELAKQVAYITAEVKWQAKFDPNRELGGKDGSKVYKVWMVEAVYPPGNKDIFFIDATNGAFLGTMSVEAPSTDAPPATSQPSADHPEEVLITQEKATELAKQVAHITAEVTWQAKYNPSREIGGKGGSKVYKVWMVEAVFPFGNKEIFFIDATNGEYLGLMIVEAP